MRSALLFAIPWAIAAIAADGKEVFYRCKSGSSYAYSTSSCKSDDGSPPQCKGPKGWSPDACEAAESEAREDAARENASRASAAREHQQVNPEPTEESMRDRFAQYCHDTGFVDTQANIDCTEEQMQAYGWLGETAKAVEKGGDEERKLTSCLMRYTNTTTGALDAKMAKLCYALPQ